MAESVRARVQPTQVLAGLVALAFLVLGIIGFAHTGVNDFAGHGHATLWGVFAINPLHNVVHLLFGVVGVLLALTSATARLYGWVLFAGYGLVLVWGLMLVGLTSTNPVSELGNPLNLNIADNWLHLGLAVLGLMIAIVPLRRKVVQTEPAPVQEPATDPVPAQQPQTVASTDERRADEDRTTTGTDERKPRGLHRLSRLRHRSTAPH
ncbi:DUF4383 domain-containing protein [Kibdelosporangium persicum]|uniref:DUF4383 domain-containing protein n=1 Tax=Kibdelosporangium persicum TaxID=2698649 RepID=A0ABX2EXZ1_9PSEU|nr:DUF4383 domain-containing protein [Kibdelosporangium persicum]NRN63631.1 hypothetical protein [Kibdelosporangium persicum]